MPRVLNDWLRSYLDFTKDQESPEKVHLWTGFAILSAALRRQVYMDRGVYKLYPNLYILIVAESGRIRKSVAMDMGVDLLKTAIPDVFTMTGAMTPEGLVKNMNRTTVTKLAKGGVIHQDSHVLIHADELATLFGFERQRASRMAILLTELYASKDRYTHTTAKEGVIEIFNAYPTLLTATDPHNMKVMPEEAVAGLLGRLIITSVSKKRRSIAWPVRAEEMLRTALIADLSSMGSIQGTCKPTTDAKAVFTSWYDKQAMTTYSNPHLDAFHERCHDTVLKLAMLLSISHDDSLVVNREHVLTAIEIIEKQLPEVTKVINWAGASIHSQNRAKLLDLLRRNGGVGVRRQLLKTMGMPVSELDALESALVQERTIERRVVGSDVFYQIIDHEEI